MRVNFGQMEVVFWPMNGQFRHCFWNFVIRPLRVNFWPLRVGFGLQKLILELCDLSLGSGGEIYLKLAY